MMGILETAPFRLGSNYPVTCIDKSQIESPSLFIFLRFRPLGKLRSVMPPTASQNTTTVLHKS